MYDLPSQTLLQQSAARPISGEELETFGKHAASGYSGGKFGTLNDAVVETVKHAGLSPEQVKRVVEFANTNAFLTEFKKESTAAKYVSFEGGPADPSEVLKDLNDGGGGTVFDRGVQDYSHGPEVIKASSVAAVPTSGLEKTASVQEPVNEADVILAEVFKAEDAPIPFESPFQDVEDAQYKLASARDSATASISELEVQLLDTNQELYGLVKQAVMEDIPLGHILSAWFQVLEPPPELVKSAFALIGPRLKEEDVMSYDQLGASLEKTASVNHLANEDHPLVRTFSGYCETVIKLAELRVSRDEIMGGLEKLATFRRLAEQHIQENA